MYSKWKMAGSYIRYYLTAANGKGHGIHSPFLFNFISKVLNDKKIYPEYEKVEDLRRRLSVDQREISFKELGAGSALGNLSSRTVSSLARNAAKPGKYGQLLFRMARQYKPRTIIELGTSLGITSSYLALGSPRARMVTMEGSPAVAAEARRNFHELGIDNIELHEGNFDEILSPVLSQSGTVDLVFVDGNHRQEPTERYFHEILKKVNNDSIIIFDDIHWSEGMEKAWKNIRLHPMVRCSVDLFFIGIVFFRQEFKEKQDFVIRF